jgi:K+-transporting ATPase ATPase A chain
MMVSLSLLLFFLLFFCISSPFLGGWIARVLTAEPAGKAINPVEKAIFRLLRIDPSREMHWLTYLWSLLIFNALGFAAVFILQITQSHLPLNPRHLPNVPAALAFNTAVSFMTNTKDRKSVV